MRRLTRKECLLQGLGLITGLGVLGALSLEGATSVGATAIAPARAAAAVDTVVNIPQTWNNCGPASIAEVLAYWGIYRTQSAVQAVLRVDGIDQGMTPYGVPAYAHSVGMEALVGFAGTQAALKALIRNGFPVIVCQWVSMGDQTSHYRPITAYDDQQAIYTSSDPYLGPGHLITYTDFARMWSPDDNPFLVLYPSSHRAVLQASLASAGWDTTRAYQYDLAWVQARLSGAAPMDPSWVGSLAVPGERFLRLAWDEAQLGHTAAARAALAQATAQGSSPAIISWISGSEVGLA